MLALREMSSMSSFQTRSTSLCCAASTAGVSNCQMSAAEAVAASCIPGPDPNTNGDRRREASHRGQEVLDQGPQLHDGGLAGAAPPAVLRVARLLAQRRPRVRDYWAREVQIHLRWVDTGISDMLMRMTTTALGRCMTS